MPQRLLIHGISYKTGDVEQGTVPCYAKADHAKVKSRPYDLLFPAPFRCGSGVQSARSKRINAHGTLPFPFHFLFRCRMTAQAIILCISYTYLARLSIHFTQLIGNNSQTVSQC